MLTSIIALGLALHVSHYSRRKLPNGERPATTCPAGCTCIGKSITDEGA